MAPKYTLRIPAAVFSGVKLPGLEAHRSSAFNVDVKMGGALSPLPTFFRGMHVENFPCDLGL